MKDINIITPCKEEIFYQGLLKKEKISAKKEILFVGDDKSYEV